MLISILLGIMATPIESEIATNDLDKMVEEELDIDEAVIEIDEVVAAANETTTTADDFNFEVWDHFHEVEVKDKKRQMVMMNKCIHCDRMYKVIMGGPTSTLK
jgi:thioredoxin-related protein